jgi:ribosomal protein S18 acetylase RimI-like enzyme
MNYIIRQVTKEDETALWEILYYAAHMEEDGETDTQAARHNPDLIKYVRDWGCPTDLGFIAIEENTNRALGAAWVRLFLGEDKHFTSVDDATPELAIATLPGLTGQGLGTQLLTRLLEVAHTLYPAIVLSVRTNNPARRLYERLGFVTITEATNRVGTLSYVMLLQFDQ